MNEEMKTLLVVDDEGEVCNFVKMFFERRKFRVVQAGSKEEAIEVARENQPDIVLLDIRMKTSDDGLEALPEIIKLVPKAQVIMTTGVDDESSMVRAKQMGAIDYITKPLILEDLEQNVLKRVRGPGD